MNSFKDVFNDKDVGRFFRVCLFLIICGYILFRILDFTDFFIQEIHCGAETTVIKKEKAYFFADGYTFDNAEFRSTEKAFEGNYSIKLSPQNLYGMTITLGTPKEKEVYEASVWFYENKLSEGITGPPSLVASIGKNTFWKAAAEVVERKDGWEKLDLKVIIPDGIYNEPLVIYCWNKTKNDVYFDNMTIRFKNYCKYF
ncbi:MAG: hypothetical protein ACXVPU_01005 [Bacteroidia bacterium]